MVGVSYWLLSKMVLNTVCTLWKPDIFFDRFFVFFAILPPSGDQFFLFPNDSNRLLYAPLVW